MVREEPPRQQPQQQEEEEDGEGDGMEDLDLQGWPGPWRGPPGTLAGRTPAGAKPLDATAPPPASHAPPHPRVDGEAVGHGTDVTTRRSAG